MSVRVWVNQPILPRHDLNLPAAAADKEGDGDTGSSASYNALMSGGSRGNRFNLCQVLLGPPEGREDRTHIFRFHPQGDVVPI